MPYYPPQPVGKPPEKRKPDRKLLRGTILAVSLLLIGYGGVKLAFYAHDYFSARRTTLELQDVVERMNEAAELIPEDAGIPLTEQKTLPAENMAAGPEAMNYGGGETALPEGAAASETTALPSVSAEAAGNNRNASGRLPAVEYPQGLNVTPRIRELRKKSDYILGWISMEDLEEPVVRKDNAFFLNHDALGNRNSNGAIFMDERTRLLTRPYTIFLYGHNMKTGAMFGNLRKYEDYSYFFRHRFFRLDTLYEEGQYAIFAVEKIQLTPGTSKYLDLNALASDDRETRRNALATLRRYSMHMSMLDVNEEDQLVLLITCVGDDDERLIVAARRVREGESI